MKLELFDYDLPKELIAQFPSRRRDQSRLMVLDRKSGETKHQRFGDLVDYVLPGDALVVNNTKVFKARLLGYRQTGARVEIFLIRHDESDALVWEALAQPTKRLRNGESVHFDDSNSVCLEEHLGEGRWRVVFRSRTARDRIIRRYGHVPLPQYISRDDQPSDIRRYQTVFADADRVGAVAAPTAGFHFTRSILDRLEAKGVELLELTLHVGPGTFKPITAGDINQHTVDPEYAELSPEVASRLNNIKACGGRVFAVGTTSVRTLESAPIAQGLIGPVSGMVDLYIKPGYQFRVVDHLITNFHLPQSSLLVLVSAFASRVRILSAYAEAVERKYRFYSYGDAMLLL